MGIDEYEPKIVNQLLEFSYSIIFSICDLINFINYLII